MCAHEAASHRYLPEWLPKCNKCMRSLGLLSASCFVLVVGAFLHCEAFFWQLSSLDLDSISLDGEVLRVLKEKKPFFFLQAHSTVASLFWLAKTCATITVNEIRKYGRPSLCTRTLCSAVSQDRRSHFFPHFFEITNVRCQYK